MKNKSVGSLLITISVFIAIAFISVKIMCLIKGGDFLFKNSKEEFWCFILLPALWMMFVSIVSSIWGYDRSNWSVGLFITLIAAAVYGIIAYFFNGFFEVVVYILYVCFLALCEIGILCDEGNTTKKTPKSKKKSNRDGCDSCNKYCDCCVGECY